MINVFYLNRIASLAKKRFNGSPNLNNRMMVLRGVLRQFDFDYDITAIISGKHDAFSIINSHNAIWIQLFPGKGNQFYAPCVRIRTRQEIRKEKLSRIYEIAREEAA